MKLRIILLLMALLLLLPAAACRAESPLVEKPLEEIMDTLYERAAEYGFAPTWNLELVDIPITPDKNDWYFGAEIDYAEALASEYIIMPPAYSVCLVRVRPGDDAAAIAETIRANADPMKWVCTGVSKVEVLWTGDLVLLIMADGTNADALADAFEALFEMRQ